MDTYKVWSMSTDSDQSDFRIEYETRVEASGKTEAVKCVQQEFLADSDEVSLTEWDWMAVKLP